MLLLLDDVKFRNKNEFYYFINNSFPGKEVLDTDALFNVLTDDDPQIEIIISDLDILKGEDKAFANEIVKVFYDAKNANPNLVITNVDTRNVRPDLTLESK